MKKKLIILGSGFGSYSLLRNLDFRLFDVTVISPRNHFLFTPLLPSTTIGTIEFRSIIEPIRNLNPTLKYIQAEARSVDLYQQQVRYSLEDGREGTLKYDLLVIGVGARTNTFDIPGVRRYGHFLKELNDARQIRKRVISNFEFASLPGIPEPEIRQRLHFVICGGGPTGIEFAAELNDFIRGDVCRFYPQLKSFIQISLVEAGQEILNVFDHKLRQAARNLFQRQHIEIITGSPVVKVDESCIHLSSGRELNYGLLVWATGNTPQPLVERLKVPKSELGQILVDEFLAVKGLENVFSLGDCALVENRPLPATAQVAQQQGRYLARQWRQRAKEKPFRFRSMGMLAYIGNDQALVDTGHVKGSGHLAWVFWRSVYLTRLVRLRNKIRVMVDWILSWIFGRDISQF
ncbi:MAG: FAD-dependent oxidoreductase [Fidelibacterota bacterium]